MARVLANQIRISLLAFSEDDRAPAELEESYERIITIRRGEGYSARNVLRGALGRTPLPLLNYTTAEMKRALGDLLSESDFDLVQIESIHLMNYLPVFRAARNLPLLICDWHNIESDLMRQYAETQTNAARKAYARRTARLMREYEQRAVQEFDGHVVVSRNDAERLREMNSSATVLVIENGVDVNYYRQDEDGGRRNQVVFVGSMDYHANIEGAIDFATNVWPGVFRQHPDLEFTIVGRHPAPAIRELAKIPGLKVTGSVEDVRRFYREALLAVVPLNVGGGSRLKILEAMAACVPVVSTTLGAEGLTVTDRENILLVDSTDQLDDAITNLIQDVDLRQRIISGGRALVTERYDWQSLGGSLSEHYRRLLSERAHE